MFTGLLICYQRSIVSTPPQANMSIEPDAFLLQLNAQLRQQLDYAKLKICALEERLRLMWIAKYGKRSETLSDLQLELLDRVYPYPQ